MLICKESPLKLPKNNNYFYYIKTKIRKAFMNVAQRTNSCGICNRKETGLEAFIHTIRHVIVLQILYHMTKELPRQLESVNSSL